MNPSRIIIDKQILSVPIIVLICCAQPVINFILTNLINHDLLFARTIVYWLILIAGSIISAHLLSRVMPRTSLPRIYWGMGFMVLFVFSEFLWRTPSSLWLNEIGLPHRLKYLIEFAVMIVIGVVIYRAAKHAFARQFMFILLSFIIVWDLALAARFVIQSNTANTAEQPQAEPSSTAPVHAPNVYYILPDSHLSERELNNKGVRSVLFDGLRARGFTLHDNARANASVTTYSMAHLFSSELIFDQLERVTPALHQQLAPEISDSNVVKTFREKGYRYVHLYDGFDGPKCPDKADICIEKKHWLDEQDFKFLDRSVLFTILQGSRGFTADGQEPIRLIGRPSRMEIDDIIKRLPPEVDGPFFLFAHLSNPHPPYRFGADCEYADLAYGDQAFLEQIQCAGIQLLQMVDHIQASDPDALIILQADTGMIFEQTQPGDTVLGWPVSTIPARLSILSAYSGPEACNKKLRADMTPVNTFRWVFACIEDTEPHYVEDRSWIVRYLSDNPSGEVIEWFTKP